MNDKEMHSIRKLWHAVKDTSRARILFYWKSHILRLQAPRWVWETPEWAMRQASATKLGVCLPGRQEASTDNHLLHPHCNVALLIQGTAPHDWCVFKIHSGGQLLHLLKRPRDVECWILIICKTFSKKPEKSPHYIKYLLFPKFKISDKTKMLHTYQTV